MSIGRHPIGSDLVSFSSSRPFNYIPDEHLCKYQFEHATTYAKPMTATAT